MQRVLRVLKNKNELELCQMVQALCIKLGIQELPIESIVFNGKEYICFYWLPKEKDGN